MNAPAAPEAVAPALSEVRIADDVFARMRMGAIEGRVVLDMGA